jgi:hypothetical protein
MFGKTGRLRLSLTLLLAMLVAMPLLGQAPTETNPHESFAGARLPDWTMVGDARVVFPEGQGVLVTNGMSFGIWRTREFVDFVLDFRYRHADGIGDVALRGKPTDPPAYLYHLGLANDRVTVIREQARQPKELGTAALKLKPGQWYHLHVQVSGGAIRVSVDGTAVLTVQDAAPLPAGITAFGSMVGNGFAYDDITLTPSQKLAAPGAGTVPGPQRIEPDVLKRLGVSRAADLLPRLRTAQDVQDLSRQSGVPTEHILFLAEDAQLREVIGSRQITDDEVILLQRVGLSHPRDVAAYRGHEEELAALLAAPARRMGVAAPTLARVKRWVQGAGANKLKGLIPAEVYSARAMAPPRTTRVSRPTWLGDGQEPAPLPARATAIAAPLPNATAPGALRPTAGLGRLTAPPVVIQPGKEWTVEFDATLGGLYHVDYHLERLGGSAELAWWIEKPNLKAEYLGGTPTPKPAVPGPATAGPAAVKAHLSPLPLAYHVTGYAPVIAQGEVLRTEVPGGPAHRAYFWVENRDVPLTRKLRLRLKVVKNVDPTAQAAGGGIEQGPATADIKNANPTIRGTLTVKRDQPQLLGFNRAVDVMFRNPRFEMSPIRVVETPLFQKDPNGGNPWGMDLRIDPEPNTYAPHMVDPKTGAPSVYDPGQTFGAALVRDDQVVPGTWGNVKGVMTFQGGAPQTGIYTLLLGPWVPGFEQLTTTGAVYGPWSGSLTTPVGADPLWALTASLTINGADQPPTMAYVAQLDMLEVSDQAEEDEFFGINDTGHGEYRVESSAIFSKRVADPKDAHYGKAPPSQTHVTGYPTSGYLFLPPAPDGALVCFPNMPLISVTADEMAHYDNLAISLRVWEDDDANGWLMLKALKGVVEKFVTTVSAMWKGDVSGVFSALKDYALEIGKVASLDEEDDVVGLPGFATSREDNFGLREGAGQASYDPRGPSDPQYIDSHYSAGKDGALVTGATGGAHWAETRISVREAPALWSWAAVQLLDFTVSTDLDAGCFDQQSPMEVYTTAGGSRNLGRQVFDTNWFGRTEALPGPKRWDWDVQANVPVHVQEAAPPYTEQDGSVLKPPGREVMTRPEAFTYSQMGFWDADPNGDTFIGMFSYAFYHQDFRTNALKWPGQAIILGGANTPNPDVGVFRKEGPYYTGEFRIHNMNNWLSEVHLKVWVYVWEG